MDGISDGPCDNCIPWLAEAEDDAVLLVVLVFPPESVVFAGWSAEILERLAIYLLPSFKKVTTGCRHQSSYRMLIP